MVAGSPDATSREVLAVSECRVSYDFVSVSKSTNERHSHPVPVNPVYLYIFMSQNL